MLRHVRVCPEPTDNVFSLPGSAKRLELRFTMTHRSSETTREPMMSVRSRDPLWYNRILKAVVSYAEHQTALGCPHEEL